MASTAVYAVHGWTGVCLLGAGVSALALAFRALSLRWVPVPGTAPMPRPA